MAGNLPSKKQRELLSFIENFISGHGYGPTYREIMRALGYKSVSTVAIHVDNLITKGYLVKRDHSARSLEIVGRQNLGSPPPGGNNERHAWLKREIEALKKSDQLDDKDLAALDRAERLLLPDASSTSDD